MRDQGDNADAKVAGIAARQHGVVSQGQLRAAGLGTSSISRRVDASRLHRIHRGVYAVGHPGISRNGRWMAAALACGEGAAVSHRSAAELWGLLRPGDGVVDVSIWGSSRRARVGIRLHRRSSSRPRQVTRRLGIPVTAPGLTISDLRRAVSAKELRHALRQADVLGLPIGAQPNRDHTRSELEREFLQLCRRHGLPAPEVNVRLGRHLVDFLWRERRLVVETDGYRYHRGRQAFEDDRSRDLDFRSLGYDVLRFSHRQVNSEPERIAAAVRDALSP